MMIRSWSLVLRCAGRAGFVVAGREEFVGVSESPFLLHPHEHGRAPSALVPLAP